MPLQFIKADTRIICLYELLEHMKAVELLQICILNLENGQLQTTSHLKYSRKKMDFNHQKMNCRDNMMNLPKIMLFIQKKSNLISDKIWSILRNWEKKMSRLKRNWIKKKAHKEMQVEQKAQIQWGIHRKQQEMRVDKSVIIQLWLKEWSEASRILISSLNLEILKVLEQFLAIIHWF